MKLPEMNIVRANFRLGQIFGQGRDYMSLAMLMCNSNIYKLTSFAEGKRLQIQWQNKRAMALQGW